MLAIGTGAAAKLAGVSSNTVRKWLDTGQLRGFHLPKSKQRRMRLEDLLNFLAAAGVPLPTQAQIDRAVKRASK